MAIKIQGNTIIDDSRNILAGNNITVSTLTVDTAASFNQTLSANVLSIVNSTNDPFKLYEYSSVDGAALRLYRFRGTPSAPLPVSSEDTLSGVRAFGAQNTSPTAVPALTASIDMIASENFSDTARGSYIKFRTTDVGTLTISEKMRLTSTGNLGLGTPTPTSTVTDGKVIHVNTGGVVGELRFTNDSSGTTTNDGAYLQYDGSILSLYNMENSYLRFGTNNLEQVRITANGNVGIGTTTPTDKLDVVGDFGLTGAINENVFTVTDGASVNLSPRNGTIQRWTLTASRTPVLPTDWPAGASMTLMINDGTAYTITWTTMAPVWVGGSAPTLATSGWTVLTFWKVSTTIYGAFVGYTA